MAKTLATVIKVKDDGQQARLLAYCAKASAHVEWAGQCFIGDPEGFYYVEAAPSAFYRIKHLFDEWGSQEGDNQ